MRHVTNPFEPLRLSHITFQGAFENDAWSTTLYEGDRAIARVRSPGKQADLELTPVDPAAISRWLDALADPSTFAGVLPAADWPMERLSDLVDRLAQLRYLDRRVSVLSHSRLVYQLSSDPDHEFHYLPSHPSPEEQIGWLRFAVGKRLARVIYKGQDCLDGPLPAAAIAPQEARAH